MAHPHENDPFNPGGRLGRSDDLPAGSGRGALIALGAVVVLIALLVFALSGTETAQDGTGGEVPAGAVTPTIPQAEGVAPVMDPTLPDGTATPPVQE